MFRILFALMLLAAVSVGCGEETPFEVTPAWEEWPSSSVWCGPDGSGPCEVVFTAGDSIPVCLPDTCVWLTKSDVEAWGR